MKVHGQPALGTSRCSSAGFSLVEALMVLTLLGLMAALVIDSGRRQLAAVKVESAARRLGTLLEHSRERAEGSRQPLDLPLHGEEGLEARVREGDASLQLDHTLPPLLRFTANGLAIDGGTAVIGSAGTDLRRCLVMSPPLGIVRVGRYQGDPGTLASDACLPDPSL